jgi:hypothetical protein
MEGSLRNSACWRSLLVTVFLSAPGAALAADNGFYVGLATSDVSSDYELGGLAGGDADDGSGFKGIVGLRPLDSFAIEANYVDLGETIVPLSVPPPCIGCATTAQIDSEAVSVSAVGFLALPLVDLFARVGYARWESEGSASETEGSDPTYGAGAQFRVGSFALRFEYERFEFDDDNADLVSVGFTYTFL